MIREFNKLLRLYGLKRFSTYLFIDIYDLLYWRLIRRSYSQKHEDLLIHQMLGNKKKGFYIDVGANDPVRFNNTYRFYLQGWRGINVEPNIDLYKQLCRIRKNDININIGVGTAKNKLKFYSFFPHTLSTFSKKGADEYIKQGFTLEREMDIKVESLSEIFRNNIKNNEEIDFLSIDIEGSDLDGLKSNDWSKYRPKIVCVELDAHYGDREESHAIRNYLKEMGYKMMYDNGLNGIFKDEVAPVGQEQSEIKEDRKVNFEYWNKYAEGSGLEVKDNTARKIEWEKITETFNITPETHPKIIELGSGCGHFVINFLKLGFNVTAVDVSEKSLEVCKKRAIHYGLDKNLELDLFDFKKPKYDQEFDAGYVISTFTCLSNNKKEQESIFGNFIKSVKKGGAVLIMEPNPLNILYYLGFPFIYRNNWREGYNIVNSTRRRMLRVLSENNITDVVVYRYGFFPTSFCNKFYFIKHVNDFLCQIPLIRNFCLFHLFVGKRGE